MGIGFAIPSNMIQLIMSQLINNGSVTRGFIGVTLQQITSDLAQAFNLDRVEGALISDVSKDSPAESAGLKQGDIIIGYDGKQVASVGSLKNAVSLMEPNSKMNLTVLRDGKKIHIPLTIAAYPEEGKTEAFKENKLGIEVEALTPEIARNYGYSNMNGVVVKKVDANSAASLAGIKNGALIVAINHQEVRSPEDFKQKINESDPSKPILFLIKQGDYMHFVSLKAG